MNDGTPFGNPGPDYGLWWRRVFAQLLDGLIIFALCLPFLILSVAMIVITASGVDTSDERSLFTVFVGLGFGLLAIYLLILVISALYAPILMARKSEHNGQTWGKQALGIRVIRDAERTPYGFGAAFVRQVLVIAVLFSWIPTIVAMIIFDHNAELLGYIPLLIDSLWPLWDKQNRALHDMVVDSRVIRVGSEADGIKPEVGE
jgi:uncharacterized RDD family membrane protein YckC